MDIFGHGRAVKCFEDNNIPRNFFYFVNGEGMSLLLSSLSTYYINDLNKSVLFITTTMCDVDDDDDRSVNDNDSGAKYQYSYCISYTQDQVVLDRQSLPVWMKNPS